MLSRVPWVEVSFCDTIALYRQKEWVDSRLPLTTRSGLQ